MEPSKRLLLKTVQGSRSLANKYSPKSLFVLVCNYLLIVGAFILLFIIYFLVKECEFLALIIV